jgi:hypothetical protein
MFVGFGIPGEWKVFQKAHPVLVQKIPSFFGTCDKIFQRKIVGSSPSADKVVFHLGMLCVEDFREILLLCANGFGVGGQKLLRGLYEKAITADYLSAHPEEGDKFFDYQWVHLKKDINHQKNLYKEHITNEDIVAEILREYDLVKDDYMEVLCKKCGTTKPQMSWTKLSTEALGIKSESLIAEMYHPCYFLPTLQTHSTMGAIFSRLKPVGEMSTYFSSGPQREEATRVLRHAHFIMLSVLNTQDLHFALDMQGELMERAKDLDSAWPKQDAPDIEPK